MKLSKPKRILITFARSFLALELARQLHQAGHKIFLADSTRCHVTRFSNAVQKSFKVPSPRFHSDDYIHALTTIVKHEKIDFILPVFEEISCLSKAKHLFPKHCELFCPSFELSNELHNKWSFQCKMKELGIDILKSYLVRTNADLEKVKFSTPYALKLCYSRSSQSVRKVFPNETIKNLSIDPHNPWIAQEWMEGNRFCTYTVCHQGKIYAHSIYPVHYAIDGYCCLTFQAIDHPGILHWIENFVGKTQFTGQIAFDFIESPQKKIYAIECNPRATSGLLLFDAQDRLDKALFKQNSGIIFPKEGVRRQIATGMLMYGWRGSSLPHNCLSGFVKDFCKTKDVVFDLKDLKPFLSSPFVFAGIFLKSRKHHLSIPAYFTYDHDWNGQPIH